MSQLDLVFCIFSFIEMSFGQCRQKIAPDSPSLRVRTPSKSHATPLDMGNSSFRFDAVD